MNTSSASYTTSWKELYQAAIHESDLNRLPERITAAESALAVRMRELFYSGDNYEEEDSLEDAMCILRALRGSLKRRAIKDASESAAA